MSSDHVIVASTTDSADAARALATGVIEAKLGACAQIVGPITSVYRWEGEVQTEQEWRVEIKTATDRVATLTEHIKANPSDSVSLFPEGAPLTCGAAEAYPSVCALNLFAGEYVGEGRIAFVEGLEDFNVTDYLP